MFEKSMVFETTSKFHLMKSRHWPANELCPDTRANWNLKNKYEEVLKCCEKRLMNQVTLWNELWTTRKFVLLKQDLNIEPLTHKSKIVGQIRLITKFKRTRLLFKELFLYHDTIWFFLQAVDTFLDM